MDTFNWTNNNNGGRPTNGEWHSLAAPPGGRALKLSLKQQQQQTNERRHWRAASFLCFSRQLWIVLGLLFKSLPITHADDKLRWWEAAKKNVQFVCKQTDTKLVERNEITHTNAAAAADYFCRCCCLYFRERERIQNRRRRRHGFCLLWGGFLFAQIVDSSSSIGASFKRSLV